MSTDSLKGFAYSILCEIANLARERCRAPQATVYGILYLAVSPSSIVALVRTNVRIDDSPWFDSARWSALEVSSSQIDKYSLNQFPKMSTSRTGEYAAATLLGADTLHTVRARILLHNIDIGYVLLCVMTIARTLYVKFVSYTKPKPTATKIIPW